MKKFNSWGIKKSVFLRKMRRLNCAIYFLSKVVYERVKFNKLKMDFLNKKVKIRIRIRG